MRKNVGLALILIAGLTAALTALTFWLWPGLERTAVQLAVVAGAAVVSGVTVLAGIGPTADLIERLRHPPEPPPPPLPTNVPMELPRYDPHFVNRQKEIEALQALLQPGQVATVWGLNGMGKSALTAAALWALHRTGELERRFPDGVIWHTVTEEGRELADACEHILAAYLPFGERAPEIERARGLLYVTQNILNYRQALIILDGVTERAELERLLNLATRGGFLWLTTRQPAGDAERVVAVGPLDSEAAVEMLGRLSGKNVSDDYTRRQMCHLVGHFPLALKLIGDHLAQGHTTPADYLAWLQASTLQALDLGQRRTESVPLLLRGWVERLTPPAQRLLLALGLHRPDWLGRSALARVLETDENDLRAALDELLRAGLVTVRLPAQGARHLTGYRLAHDLIRQFVQQRLSAERAAETHTLLERWVALYLGWVAAEMAEGPEGYAEVRPLLGPLLGLNGELLAREMWTTIMAVVDALDRFISLHGHGGDRALFAQDGLEAARGAGDRRQEGRYLGILGNAYDKLGRYEEAIEQYQQALIIDREIGDRQGEGDCLGSLGTAYDSLGRCDEAINHHQQALAIARAIGNRQGEGSWLRGLGNAYLSLGRDDEAIEQYQQALTIARAIGDRRTEGKALGNLGVAHGSLGRYDKAIEQHQQALTIARAIGDRRTEGAVLGNLGNAYGSLGRIEEAIEQYQQALTIARTIGDRQMEGNALGNLGNAYKSLGRYEEAMGQYEQALTIARAIGDRASEGDWLRNIGSVYKQVGRVSEARALWRQALVIYEAIHSPKAATVRRWLAE